MEVWLDLEFVDVIIMVLRFNLLLPNSLLSEILDILQPYYEMTKILSATGLSYVKLVYPSMFKLIKKVSPPEHDDDHYADTIRTNQKFF